MSVLLGIIRAHRGGIFVTSTKGYGTTIKVVLPVNLRAKASQDVVPDGERIASSRNAVLVVDDESHVRVITGHMLRRAGFSVIEARDGFEALRILQEDVQQVGCVILDLSMPDLDGEETFRMIRQAGLDVPVILSSGYDETEVTLRFGASDLAGFLQKPYTRSDLLALVTAAQRAEAS